MAIFGDYFQGGKVEFAAQNPFQYLLGQEKDLLPNRNKIYKFTIRQTNENTAKDKWKERG